MVKVSSARVFAWVFPLVTAACGNYYGQTNFLNTTHNGQLNDGIGACAGDDHCINLDFTESTVLAKGTYTLQPKNNVQVTYIKVTNGASLVIEPGTTILGNEKTALIVARGSTVIAAGTQDEPVVFTSANPVGQRNTGDWGGVLLLGNAPANNLDPNDATNRTQFEALPEDPDGQYGGDDPNDSNGMLRYSRIEFGGFTYAENEEFNGLSLCAVGRGTILDHIQVHRSSDDGIEFFGGNPDMKYIVSSQNEDDGYDTDQGYSGRTQFLIVQHINGKTSDPNGYESDNAPTAAKFDLSPRTHPTIYNATLIGMKDPAVSTPPPGPSFGMVARRGTSGRYFNHIIMNFQHQTIDVRDTATTALFPSEFFFKTSVFFNNAQGANWENDSVLGDNDGGFDEHVQFLGNGLGNTEVDPKLASPQDLTAPSFLPQTVIVGTVPENDGFFDTSANFVGAIGTFDWTKGWTSFPQN